jgi:hypothetical protein
MRPGARRSLRGVVVPVVTAVVAAGTLAYAAAGAVASASSRATSGSYGAAATAPGGAANGAYVITWSSPLTAQPLDLANTGTLSLASVTFAATNSKPSGTAPPEIAFDACVNGTWSGSTCSGTTVRIATTSGGSLSVVTTTVPVAGGSRLALRASPTSLYNFPQTFTTVVNVTVTRAQVRTATVTTT